jgi:hypothetical protein
VRHAADRPFAARRTAIAARHIRRHAAFVDKDQPAGVQLRLDVAPGLPCRGDIGTALLRGVLGLFLRVNSSRRSVFQMPRRLLDIWCVSSSQARSSANVTSGSAFSLSRIASWYASSLGGT